MKNTTPLTVAFVLAAATVFAGTASAGETMIDDFEAYTPGQVIGLSYNSEPWFRFGAATNDNVVATNRAGKLINGKLSAQYGVAWPNTFGAVRFKYKTPADLSDAASATVQMRSDHPESHTFVKLAIIKGDTTFASRTPQAVPANVETLTFQINEDDMIHIAGPDDFQDVIQGADAIGFNFHSIEGTYFETIVFDDFCLTNKAAE